MKPFSKKSNNKKKIQIAFTVDVQGVEDIIVVDTRKGDPDVPHKQTNKTSTQPLQNVSSILELSNSKLSLQWKIEKKPIQSTGNSTVELSIQAAHQSDTKQNKSMNRQSKRIAKIALDRATRKNEYVMKFADSTLSVLSTLKLDTNDNTLFLPSFKSKKASLELMQHIPAKKSSKKDQLVCVSTIRFDLSDFAPPAPLLDSLDRTIMFPLIITTTDSLVYFSAKLCLQIRSVWILTNHHSSLVKSPLNRTLSLLSSDSTTDVKVDSATDGSEGIGNETQDGSWTETVSSAVTPLSPSEQSNDYYIIKEDKQVEAWNKMKRQNREKISNSIGLDTIPLTSRLPNSETSNGSLVDKLEPTNGELSDDTKVLQLPLLELDRLKDDEESHPLSKDSAHANAFKYEQEISGLKQEIYNLKNEIKMRDQQEKYGTLLGEICKSMSQFKEKKEQFQQNIKKVTSFCDSVEKKLELIQKKKTGFPIFLNENTPSVEQVSPEEGKDNSDEAQIQPSDQVSPIATKISSSTNKISIVYMDICEKNDLWDVSLETMNDSLDVFDSVYKECMKLYQGNDLDIGGDSESSPFMDTLIIAFSSARKALKFSILFQQRLHNANWPTQLLQQQKKNTEQGSFNSRIYNGITVRMGIDVGVLHTSEVDCYFDKDRQRYIFGGKTIQRSIAIGSIAKAGQVLTSHKVWTTLAEELELKKKLSAEGYIETESSGDSIQVKTIVQNLGKVKLEKWNEEERLKLVIPEELRGREFKLKNLNLYPERFYLESKLQDTLNSVRTVEFETLDSQFNEVQSEVLKLNTLTQLYNDLIKLHTGGRDIDTEDSNVKEDSDKEDDHLFESITTIMDHQKDLLQKLQNYQESSESASRKVSEIEKEMNHFCVTTLAYSSEDPNEVIKKYLDEKNVKLSNNENSLSVQNTAKQQEDTQDNHDEENSQKTDEQQQPQNNNQKEEKQHEQTKEEASEKHKGGFIPNKIDLESSQKEMKELQSKIDSILESIENQNQFLQQKVTTF